MRSSAPSLHLKSANSTEAGFSEETKFRQIKHSMSKGAADTGNEVYAEVAAANNWAMTPLIIPFVLEFFICTRRDMPSWNNPLMGSLR